MVVQHPDCIPEVKEAYIDFLAHCFIDTEMEMKEIYTSNHIWTLLENFLIDIGTVSSAPHDRNHADFALENYVTNSIINLITIFFNSPYSDQSSVVQVCHANVCLWPFVYLMICLVPISFFWFYPFPFSC